MRKRYCIVAQIVLLWFFLDMTGLYFENKCLVTRSYKEDGICFLIYLITIILFLIKENILLSGGCQCGLLYNLCVTSGILFLTVDLWDH